MFWLRVCGRSRIAYRYLRLSIHVWKTRFDLPRYFGHLALVSFTEVLVRRTEDPLLQSITITIMISECLFVTKVLNTGMLGDPLGLSQYASGRLVYSRLLTGHGHRGRGRDPGRRSADATYPLRQPRSNSVAKRTPYTGTTLMLVGKGAPKIATCKS